MSPLFVDRRGPGPLSPEEQLGDIEAHTAIARCALLVPVSTIRVRSGHRVIRRRQVACEGELLSPSDPYGSSGVPAAPSTARDCTSYRLSFSSSIATSTASAFGPSRSDQELGRPLSTLALTSTRSGNTVAALRKVGVMRSRSALGIAFLVGFLVLGMATPAHAAARLRLYRGETSQMQRISFVVAKTNSGRFVRGFDAQLTFTCDDESTQDVGWGFGLGNRQVPVVDRAFAFDEVDQTEALHLAGDLGSLHGQGTLTLSFPAFTQDEQLQVCTTGDLTWTVEFVRTL